MRIPDKAITVAQKAMQGGAMSAFFGFWNGRCTFFASAFSIIGVYGWLVLDRDLTSFAVFAGAIQALLVVRSASQDYHERKTQSQGQDLNSK